MKACNKAKELHLLKSRGIQEKEQPYFFINVDYSLLKVVFSDIMWIEGLKDYVKIHLKSSNKPIVARMSIKALEEELPVSMFVRVQKSYIVSKEYVTAIRKNSVFIGNNEIPVGDNFKEALDKLTGK
jgi:DNA-binding LytR/AlgR family response regulator